MTSHLAAAGCDGTITSARRSIVRHEAIRDCGSEASTLARMGIPSSPTETRRSIERMCERLSSSECSYTTATGLRVLQTVIDPFAACWIAPDHLLTGHMEDCLNLAFQPLSSTHLRRTVEAMILTMLRDCSLRTQNNILTKTTLQVLKMSMSDMFCVFIVASLAFKLGLAVVTIPSSSSVRLPESLFSSLDLIASASKLIADLLWSPSASVDTRQSFFALSRRGSVDHVNTLRLAVALHLSKVRAICTPPRSVLFELNNSGTTATRRRELHLIEASC